MIRKEGSKNIVKKDISRFISREFKKQSLLMMCIYSFMTGIIIELKNK